MIKEIYNQLPMFPCFRIKGTDKEFFTIHDAAKELGTVTPNPEHELIRRPGFQHWKYVEYNERSSLLQTRGYFTRPTLFQEIESKTPETIGNIKDYFNKSFGKEKIDADGFSILVANALVDSLRKQWDSSKLHIMPFSSGYDSRMIALVLEKLYKENGPDWFGDMIFFTFEPEIEAAKNIFNGLAFPKDWLVPIRPGNKTGIDYYSEVMDFDKIGKWYCEAERFWAGPVLARMVLIDEMGLGDAVGVSALFSDETSKANRLSSEWPNVGYFVGCFHFDNPTPFLGTDIRFIFPFTSQEYLDVITKYRMPLKVDDNKLNIIKHLNEDFTDIVKYPNFRFEHAPVLKEHGHDKFQTLSSNTVAQMENSFLQSWYCKTYKKSNLLPFPTDFPYYSKAGTEYIKAAIYENLINAGCKFNV
jgi:hypothetical protein